MNKTTSTDSNVKSSIDRRSVEQQFTAALQARGIIAPSQLIADGKTHRADVAGHNGKSDAIYSLHLDGHPAGGFKNFKDNLGWQDWKVDTSTPTVERPTDDDAGEASKIWESLREANPKHHYLVDKNIKPHVARQKGNRIVLPVQRDTEIVGLQYIFPDSTKRFLPGTKKTGAYCALGKLTDAGAIICEGFATGASLREVLHETVVVAFDCGNLLPVAKHLRERFKDAPFVIAADDDHRTDGNPGLTHAMAAARAVNGLVMVPAFGKKRPDDATDFNDLRELLGDDAIERALDKARRPDKIAPHRLHPMTLDAFLAEEIPEQKAILAPWLIEESNAMVHAWRGGCKTLFLQNIAYAIATGGEFLGWKADRAWPVLYLDGEMSAKQMQKRFAMIRRSDPRKDIDVSLLRVVTPRFVKGKMPNLALTEGQAEIDEILGDAKVIFVDSIVRFVRSVHGENEQQSWQQADTWQLDKRREGRSVVWAHHDNKEGGQRGTSGREDTLDTVIHLKRPSDYRIEDRARFEVRFEKDRPGIGDVLQPFEAKMEDVAGAKVEWVTASTDESTFEKVVELANLGLSRPQIVKELKVDRSTVWRHYKKAVKKGLITTPEKD